MTDGGDNSGRDARGRFRTGNPGGPSGPRRSSLLRQAVAEAVTSEQLAALTRRILRMALEGNLPAARLVYERTCGRTAESPAEAEPVDLAMPRMRTAVDCSLALERLVDAICKGTIDRDTATTLIAAVKARLHAIEVSELEQRLGELEQTAATSELRPEES